MTLKKKSSHQVNQNRFLMKDHFNEDKRVAGSSQEFRQ
jgi:hypothetical protein